jgi:N-acetylglutamate synthase-like GNAT family acetyltransferase
MGSFWRETLCAPTWTSYLESWLYSYPSKLIDNSNHLLKVSLPQGFVLRQATAADVEQLPEFWTRYFSDSTRCIVPLLHIQKKLSSWTILVVVKEEIVIGSLVRRLITNLHMREVVWKSAGVIDYFCIHPAYRKRGIGRSLLSAIHNMTEKPIQPHLMLLEGVQTRIPPCAAGVFVSKRCQHTNLAIREVVEGHQAIWAKCVKDCLVKSDWIGGAPGSAEGKEVSLWQIGDSYFAIWNTFHHSIPDGARIGIILGYTGDLEKVAATVGHGFGVLLLGVSVADSIGHSWSMDSPFQWISYNTNNGFIGGFPALCF